MSYLTSKLAELTEELFTVTRLGKLVWRAEGADGNFVTQIEALRVMLEKGTGSDGLPTVAISLFDREGGLAQRFTDHDLSDLAPNDEEYRSYWELMAELHETAGGSAGGIFTLIDSFLAVLTPMAKEAHEDEDEGDSEDWEANPLGRGAQIRPIFRRNAA